VPNGDSKYLLDNQEARIQPIAVSGIGAAQQVSRNCFLRSLRTLRFNFR
jgi:hypothetical protein